MPRTSAGDVTRLFRPDLQQMVDYEPIEPTDVQAEALGVEICKVFPGSQVGGPGFVKSVRAPMPWARLMPTGGVNLDTAADFLRAGACALGVGGALASAKRIAEGDLAEIESVARQFVEIVQAARE